jgi:hypothetical protein
MKRTKTKTVHVLFVLKTVWMTPKDAAALVKETPYAFILTAEDEAQLKENERRTRELCRHVKAAAEAWKRMDSRVLLGLLK